MGKVSAPPPFPATFNKTCPCTIFPPSIFNFSDPPPSRGGNQNLLPSFKKGWGIRTMIEVVLKSLQIQKGLFTNKKVTLVSRNAVEEKNLHPCGRKFIF